MAFFTYLGVATAALLFLAGLAALAYYAWLLAGFLLGAFRLRRYDLRQTPGILDTLRHGLSNFVDCVRGGSTGWYCEYGGRKVYLFGFYAVDSDHLL